MSYHERFRERFWLHRVPRNTKQMADILAFIDEVVAEIEAREIQRRDYMREVHSGQLTATEAAMDLNNAISLTAVKESLRVEGRKQERAALIEKVEGMRMEAPYVGRKDADGDPDGQLVYENWWGAERTILQLLSYLREPEKKDCQYCGKFPFKEHDCPNKREPDASQGCCPIRVHPYGAGDAAPLCPVGSCSHILLPNEEACPCHKKERGEDCNSPYHFRCPKCRHSPQGDNQTTI